MSRRREMRRGEAGSAQIDVLVWLVIWAVILPPLVALAATPAAALRYGSATVVAAREASRARSALDAERAATRVVARNAAGAGWRPPCVALDLEVDTRSLRPTRALDGRLRPGHANATVACTVERRRLLAAPLPGTVTLRFDRSSVGDAYRRVE